MKKQNIPFQIGEYVRNIRPIERKDFRVQPGVKFRIVGKFKGLILEFVAGIPMQIKNVSKFDVERVG